MREPLKLGQPIHTFLSQFGVGRKNAVKAARLAHMFDSTIRGISDEIRLLRKAGILIGSSKEEPYGYYIPATLSEAKDCLQTFKSETLDMLQTLNRLKRTLRTYEESIVQPQFVFDKTGQAEIFTPPTKEVNHVNL